MFLSPDKCTIKNGNVFKVGLLFIAPKTPSILLLLAILTRPPFFFEVSGLAFCWCSNVPSFNLMAKRVSLWKKVRLLNVSGFICVPQIAMAEGFASELGFTFGTWRLMRMRVLSPPWTWLGRVGFIIVMHLKRCA